jgi:hypothetical protein
MGSDLSLRADGFINVMLDSSMVVDSLDWITFNRLESLGYTEVSPTHIGPSPVEDDVFIMNHLLNYMITSDLHDTPWPITSRLALSFSKMPLLSAFALWTAALGEN